MGTPKGTPAPASTQRAGRGLPPTDPHPQTRCSLLGERTPVHQEKRERVRQERRRPPGPTAPDSEPGKQASRKRPCGRAQVGGGVRTHTLSGMSSRAPVSRAPGPSQGGRVHRPIPGGRLARGRLTGQGQTADNQSGQADTHAPRPPAMPLIWAPHLGTASPGGGASGAPRPQTGRVLSPSLGGRNRYRGPSPGR